LHLWSQWAVAVIKALLSPELRGLVPAYSPCSSLQLLFTVAGLQSCFLFA
jgi:hypothetical protein